MAVAASVSTSECAASVKPVERSRTRQQRGQSKRKDTKEKKGGRGLHQMETSATKHSTATTGGVGDANMQKRPRKTCLTHALLA